MHSIKYFNLELDRYLGTDDISFINVNILIVVVKNLRQNDAPHFSGDQVLKLHYFFLNSLIFLLILATLCTSEISQHGIQKYDQKRRIGEIIKRIDQVDQD